MCRTSSLLLLARIICRAGLASSTFTNCLARCPFLVPGTPVLSKLVEWLRGGREWESNCEVGKGKGVALLILFFSLVFFFLLSSLGLFLFLGSVRLVSWSVSSPPSPVESWCGVAVVG